MKKLIGFTVLFSLGACVSDDPRQGGFFGGVAGLSSGKYEQRIANRRQSLAVVQNMQQDLQVDNARLQREKQAKLSEIKRTKRHLSSLQRENRSLKNRIASLRRNNKITAQQARKMQQEAQQLGRSIAQQNSRLAHAQSSKDTAELARVRAKVNALKRQQQEQAKLALIMAQ